MPTSVPRIVAREAQPYLAIAATVTMDEIAAAADRLPEVMGWLAERGIAPAGPPFFRYDVIDMPRELRMQVGAPVSSARPGAGEVIAGILPAGHYALVCHTGHPQELMGVTKALLEWAAEQGLRWDMTASPEGERWGCRLEVYHTDPRDLPDMSHMRTDLVFRLAD
jgi:effector-binding domain-containing protein